MAGDIHYLRSLYHGAYCTESLVRAVSENLDQNAHRLSQGGDAAARRTLLHARADAALLAGRLALFDTGSPLMARGWLTVAAEAAREASDDALTAAALTHLAFLPIREHLPRASADYLTAAHALAERTGVPTLVSWVSAVEAEILGPTRPDGGRRALERAENALSGSAQTPAPDWFDFYSPARLDGFRGHALLAGGNGAPAREALTRALDALEPGAVKQRAVLLVDLAASAVCGPAPDVERAAAYAVRATEELACTGYQPAAERLAALRRRLGRWEGTDAVRALDEAMSTGQEKITTSCTIHALPFHLSATAACPPVTATFV